MIYFSPAATTVWKCPTDDPKEDALPDIEKEKAQRSVRYASISNAGRSRR